MWTATVTEIIQQVAPELDVTEEKVSFYLQSGFPWHTHEQTHLDIQSADQWWRKLAPLFEQVFFEIGFSQLQAQVMSEQVRSVYTDPERWRLFDDTVSTLEHLSLYGWKHVVLSNHVPELSGIIQHLQLTPYISRVFNSAETGYEKPHCLAFHTILDAFPEETSIWMIGDSITADIKGSAAVGIPGILVRRYHADAKLYCEDLTGLQTIVSDIRYQR